MENKSLKTYQDEIKNILKDSMDYTELTFSQGQTFSNPYTKLIQRLFLGNRKAVSDNGAVGYILGTVDDDNYAFLDASDCSVFKVEKKSLTMVSEIEGGIENLDPKALMNNSGANFEVNGQKVFLKNERQGIKEFGSNGISKVKPGTLTANTIAEAIARMELTGEGSIIEFKDGKAEVQIDGRTTILPRYITIGAIVKTQSLEELDINEGLDVRCDKSEFKSILQLADKGQGAFKLNNGNLSYVKRDSSQHFTPGKEPSVAQVQMSVKTDTQLLLDECNEKAQLVNNENLNKAVSVLRERPLSFDEVKGLARMYASEFKENAAAKELVVLILSSISPNNKQLISNFLGKFPDFFTMSNSLQDAVYDLEQQATAFNSAVPKLTEAKIHQLRQELRAGLQRSMAEGISENPQQTVKFRHRTGAWRQVGGAEVKYLLNLKVGDFIELGVKRVSKDPSGQKSEKFEIYRYKRIDEERIQQVNLRKPYEEPKSLKVVELNVEEQADFSTLLSFKFPHMDITVINQMVDKHARRGGNLGALLQKITDENRKRAFMAPIPLGELITAHITDPVTLEEVNDGEDYYHFNTDQEGNALGAGAFMSADSVKGSIDARDKFKHPTTKKIFTREALGKFRRIDFKRETVMFTAKDLEVLEGDAYGHDQGSLLLERLNIKTVNEAKVIISKSKSMLMNSFLFYKIKLSDSEASSIIQRAILALPLKKEEENKDIEFFTKHLFTVAHRMLYSSSQLQCIAFQPQAYFDLKKNAIEVLGGKTLAVAPNMNYLEFASGGLVYSKIIEGERKLLNDTDQALSQLILDISADEDEISILTVLASKNEAAAMLNNTAFSQEKLQKLIKKLEGLENTVVNTARQFHLLLLKKGVTPPTHWPNDVDRNGSSALATQKIQELARVAIGKGYEFSCDDPSSAPLPELASAMSKDGLIGVLGGAMRYSPHHIALFMFLNDMSPKGRESLTEENLSTLLKWVVERQQQAIAKAREKLANARTEENIKKADNGLEKQKNLGVWTEHMIHPEMARLLLQAAKAELYIIPSWEGSALYFSFVNPIDLTFSERLCFVKGEKLFISNNCEENLAEYSSVLLHAYKELSTWQNHEQDRMKRIVAQLRDENSKLQGAATELKDVLKLVLLVAKSPQKEQVHSPMASIKGSLTSLLNVKNRSSAAPQIEFGELSKEMALEGHSYRDISLKLQAQLARDLTDDEKDKIRQDVTLASTAITLAKHSMDPEAIKGLSKALFPFMNQLSEADIQFIVDRVDPEATHEQAKRQNYLPRQSSMSQNGTQTSVHDSRQSSSGPVRLN